VDISWTLGCPAPSSKPKELPRRIVRPAAFIGRDVALNLNIGEAPRMEGLGWVRGAREPILDLNEAGYPVFVTTNDGAEYAG
jgi:hypothetical protein